MHESEKDNLMQNLFKQIFFFIFFLLCFIHLGPSKMIFIACRRQFRDFTQRETYILIATNVAFIYLYTQKPKIVSF